MRNLLTALLLISMTTTVLAKGPLDEALKSLQGAEYRAAIDLAEKVAATNEAERARARYIVGEARFGLGEFVEAEKAFRAVIELRPEAVPAHTGVARALLRQGKAADAEAAANKAIALDAKDAESLRTLGEALLEQGKDREARKPLAAAYKINRKDPLNARALFNYHVKGERLPKAKSVADRLAKDRRGHPMGWFLKGIYLDRSGKDEEAIKAYEKAIEIDDTYIDAHKNLAILCTAKNPLYRNLERTKKALAHYKRYFELGGKDPELKQLYTTIDSFLSRMNNR